MLSPEAKVASRPKFWPRSRPQSFGLGLGLKHLASAWPRFAAEEPAAKNSGPICLHFTLLTTGHHTMMEDSHCPRENEKLNCVVLIIMI